METVKDKVLKRAEVGLLNIEACIKMIEKALKNDT